MKGLLEVEEMVHLVELEVIAKLGDMVARLEMEKGK